MTKLADAIRRSQRIEAAPMGFGAARSAPKDTMVVAALVDAAADLAGLKEAGADVVLIDARSKALSDADATRLGSAANGLSLGLLATGIDAAASRKLCEAGFDFLAFDPETTSAAALLEDDMGYVLLLPEQPEELFLRSLESLSLDGLYLERPPASLTVARQLELNRVALLAHKPLLCQVQPDVSAEDLRLLRGAGAAVVLTTGGAAAVKQLKSTVGSLPPRRVRREERTVVSLPRGAAAIEEEEDDDD
jgi:hypothetical protein